MRKYGYGVLLLVLAMLLAACAVQPTEGVLLATPGITMVAPTPVPEMSPTPVSVVHSLPTAIPSVRQAITVTNTDALNVVAALPVEIGMLTQIAFSPDGLALAASDASGSVQVVYMDSNTAQIMPGEAQIDDNEFTRSMWNAQPAGAINFEPDNGNILTISSEYMLWRHPATGEIVHRQPMDIAPQMPVSVSLDGHFLAIGYQEQQVSYRSNGVVHLYDRTGEMGLRELKAHTGYINAIAFSPSGDMLASGGLDHYLYLWSVEQDEPLRQIDMVTRRVAQLVFSMDGSLIAAGDRDGFVRIWNSATGDLLQEIDAGYPVSSLALSPDGSLVVAVNPVGSLRVWQVADGQLLYDYHNDNFIDGQTGRPVIAFSPDGTLIAASDPDNGLNVWGVDL